MIELFAIPLMAVLARLCGWGGMPKGFGGFPEILFGFIIGAAVLYNTNSVIAGLLAWIWSWLWMESGHGNAYHDGTKKDAFSDRFQAPIDYIVRPICKLLKWEIRGTAYCRLFMAFKGLMIGLPLFPYGLLLAPAWTASYAISFRVLKRDSMPAEWISGAAAGACVALYLGLSWMIL